MRVRAGAPGPSLLAQHPLLGLAVPAPPAYGATGAPGVPGVPVHVPARARIVDPRPIGAGEGAPPRAAIRREPTGPLGLNFSDLAEGQEFLERYRIVRKIGRGGFGTVYLAQDFVIQEDIILKILNPQLSMDDVATRRFVQELKLTRRVSHKNVIRIHDFLDLGGARAISMEYFPGKDLGRIFTEEGALELRRGLRIGAQVCDGLAAAHAEGVMHRDIKPANILVGEGDETRLVDFGLASAHNRTGDGSRLTKSGLLIGTPEYMAPEQITDEGVDHRVDLYSLGIVLYETFAGTKPFQADTPVKILFQHLEGGAAPLSRVVPGFPAEVEALVARAMARNRDERPSSAIELRDEIVRCLAALEVAS
jgi:serine/threonine-protein kinase